MQFRHCSFVLKLPGVAPLEALAAKMHRNRKEDPKYFYGRWEKDHIETECSREGRNGRQGITKSNQTQPKATECNRLSEFHFGYWEVFSRLEVVRRPKATKGDRTRPVCMIYILRPRSAEQEIRISHQPGRGRGTIGRSILIRKRSVLFHNIYGLGGGRKLEAVFCCFIVKFYHLFTVSLPISGIFPGKVF